MNAIVTVTCRDQIGIVSALSTLLHDNRCNILESQQFSQPDAGTVPEDGVGTFFMRIECALPDGFDCQTLDAALATVRERFDATITVNDPSIKLRTVIMVSRHDHCLEDILYRVRTRALPIDIVAVVSNHPDSQERIEGLGIPYHHWPVTPETKLEQEKKLGELISRENVELVVLARYMQVLSDTMAGDHFGRIINIHHSFLPAFKGAKPYHRAYERGVKHIGATAHYVTPELDEGPIIEQDVERVSHAQDADELVRRGRDIESRVLARALRLHAERRVFINGRRSVVFAK